MLRKNGTDDSLIMGGNVLQRWLLGERSKLVFAISSEGVESTFYTIHLYTK